MRLLTRLNSLHGNVYAVIVILGVLAALTLSVLVPAFSGHRPAHQHCHSYSFASGESGNGCS